MTPISPLVLPRVLGRLAWLLASVLPLAVDAQISLVPVGVAYQADFAVTGAPKNAASYALWGLPPGLTVVGAGQSADTYALSGPFGTITGTPTTVGTYAVNITAWESSDHTGANWTHVYTLVVSDGSTPLPPEPAAIIPPLPAPVVTNPPPVVTSGDSSNHSGSGGGGGGAPSFWFTGLLALLRVARLCRARKMSGADRLIYD